MLVLADRGFGGSYELFGEFAERGAELVWRVKSNAVLPVAERLDDGSFRSELSATKERPARAVRVVAYEVDDPGRPQAEDRTYRLATTILEPERVPATDLAGLYAERWAIVMSSVPVSSPWLSHGERSVVHRDVSWRRRPGPVHLAPAARSSLASIELMSSRPLQAPPRVAASTS